jgi:CubicO group peptidase (beta-lactamase class C family)
MSKSSRWFLPPFLLVFVFVPVLLAQELPTVKPQEVGLAPERLARVHQALQEHVEKNHIAGAVALIARHGKVAYLDTVGLMDIEAKKPMRPDTIFRIASMTKPITSLAVMMLYEEGRFLLSDPVSKFIPEFHNPKVAVRSPAWSPLAPSYVLVPAKREITLRDLLVHTSGITYQFWGREYFADLYKKAGISDGLIQTEGTIADEVKKLAQVPLTNQPGEAFEYGLNTDVLGYVIEVVSGMPLDQFFQERIFTPLAMKDTHFFLPEDKVPRLAAVYTANNAGGITKLSDEPVREGEHTVYSATFHYKGPRSFLSGGAGLVSTIADYYRFVQMLLNGGEWHGVRLVSRKTVELMRSNHLGNLDMWLGSPGEGFGLGFGVVKDMGQVEDMKGSAGTYYWGGFFSTTFWIDPQEDLIGLFMTQVRPFSPHKILDQFRVLTYQALAD